MSRADRVANPKCRHVPWGTVSAGDPSPDGGAFASTVVCDRDACIEDARDWVRVKTGGLEPKPFKPFPGKLKL